MDIKDLAFVLFEPFYLAIYYLFVTRYLLKEKNKKVIIMSVIAFIVNIIFYLLDCNPIINIIESITISFLILFVASKKIKLSILVAFEWMAIGIVAEALGAYIVALYLGLDQNEIINSNGPYVLGMFLSRVILFAYALYNSRKKFMGDKYQWYLFTILFFGTIFLVLLMDKLAGNNAEMTPLMVIADAVVLGLDLFIVFLLNVIDSNMQREKELIITNNYLKLQEIAYDKEKELREKERIERHDFKNKIYLLKSYADDNRIDELKKTLKEWEGINNDKKLILTGNEVLDIILNSKKACAEKNDISLNLSVELKEILVIKDVDLVTILGNLLDNAIEAVAKIDNIEERKIECNILYDKAVLKISINNALAEPVKIKKNGLFETSKKEKGHGYGIKSIYETAKKYNGDVDFSVEDNIFSVQIYLYILENNYGI